MAGERAYSRSFGLESQTSPANGLASWLAPHLSIDRSSPLSSSSLVGASLAVGPSRSPHTSGRDWRSSSTKPRSFPTSRQGLLWICTRIQCVSGGVAGRRVISPWPIRRDAGESPIFPPRDQAVVKAIACEAVNETQLPLSRLSTTDLAARATIALSRRRSVPSPWP